MTTQEGSAMKVLPLTTPIDAVAELYPGRHDRTKYYAKREHFCQTCGAEWSGPAPVLDPPILVVPVRDSMSNLRWLLFGFAVCGAIWFTCDFVWVAS